MSTLVVGSVALDTISNVHGTIDEGLGGSAVYFSLAASPFTQVNMVAVVGDDFSPAYIELLKNKKVGTEGIKTVRGKTFRWKGEYTPSLDQAITLDTQLNVFEEFSPEIPPRYSSPSTLFLANIDPVLQLDVLGKMENSPLTACDTMNFWIEGKRNEVLELLKKVNILFINEDEAKQLTARKALGDSAQELLKCGPQTIVIKRGSSGVILFQENRLFISPAFLNDAVIDTTGAGDCFAGGFMGYLDKTADTSWENLKRATVMGTMIASFNIESFSVHRLNMLRREEIVARWSTFHEMTQWSKEPLPLP